VQKCTSEVLHFSDRSEVATIPTPFFFEPLHRCNLRGDGGRDVIILQEGTIRSQLSLCCTHNVMKSLNKLLDFRLVFVYTWRKHNYTTFGRILKVMNIESNTEIHDEEILPFMDFVRRSGLSERTCRRICVPGGSGPPTIRLSERRLGVQMCDYRAWVKQGRRVV
jgi:hypothetical protein